MTTPFHEGSHEKTRRAYSAVSGVWMGCPVSSQMSRPPLDSCVCSGFPWQESEQWGCCISDLEKTICDQPFQASSEYCPRSLSSLSGSYPDLASMSYTLLRWGKGALLKTAILGVVLTKSVFIWGSSLVATLHFPPSILINAHDFFLLASNHL